MLMQIPFTVLVYPAAGDFWSFNSVVAYGFLFGRSFGDGPGRNGNGDSIYIQTQRSQPCVSIGPPFRDHTTTFSPERLSSSTRR